MKQYFYIDAQGNQVGPIGLEELRRAGISTHTLVWTEGMPAWSAASTLTELAGSLPPPFPGVPPRPFSPSDAGEMKPANTMEKPDSNLTWAILSTLLCCLPFGIVAIVKATNVDPLWRSGQREEAVHTSKEAERWCYFSVIASIIAWIIILIITQSNNFE